MKENSNKKRGKNLPAACAIILILTLLMGIQPLYVQGRETYRIPVPAETREEAPAAPVPAEVPAGSGPAEAPFEAPFEAPAVVPAAPALPHSPVASAAPAADNAAAGTSEPGTAAGSAGSASAAGTAAGITEAAASSNHPVPVPPPAVAAPAPPIAAEAAAVPQPSPLPSASPAPVVAARAVQASNNDQVRNLQVKIQLTNKGEAHSRNIRVEIPMLAELDSPYQTLLGERFSHQPAALNRLELGSRIMVVEIPSLAPGVSETITLDYALAVQNPQAAQTSAAAAPARFLAPSPKVESDHADIMAAASRIVQNSPDTLEKAREIYSFVIGHMTYSKDTPARNQGALSALTNKIGVCEDYASLFAALCRAAGIPARVVKGYADPGGTGSVWNLSPGQSLAISGFRHAWAEFYMEGRGWLPADPTFESSPDSFRFFGSLPYSAYIAQTYLDQNLRVRFQGGQLAATWVESLVN